MAGMSRSVKLPPELLELTGAFKEAAQEVGKEIKILEKKANQYGKSGKSLNASDRQRLTHLQDKHDKLKEQASLNRSAASSTGGMGLDTFNRVASASGSGVAMGVAGTVTGAVGAIGDISAKAYGLKKLFEFATNEDARITSLYNHGQRVRYAATEAKNIAQIAGVFGRSQAAGVGEITRGSFKLMSMGGEGALAGATALTGMAVGVGASAYGGYKLGSYLSESGWIPEIWGLTGRGREKLDIYARSRQSQIDQRITNILKVDNYGGTKFSAGFAQKLNNLKDIEKQNFITNQVDTTLGGWIKRWVGKPLNKEQVEELTKRQNTAVDIEIIKRQNPTFKRLIDGIKDSGEYKTKSREIITGYKETGGFLYGVGQVKRVASYATHFLLGSYYGLWYRQSKIDAEHEQVEADIKKKSVDNFSAMEKRLKELQNKPEVIEASRSAALVNNAINIQIYETGTQWNRY